MTKPESREVATTAATAFAAPAALQPDKHHGTGGLYRIVNGQRVLVDRSKAAADVKSAVQSAA